MTTLIVYLSEDKKCQRVIHPAEYVSLKDERKAGSGKAPQIDYSTLAHDLCQDAGDTYHGHAVITL